VAAVVIRAGDESTESGEAWPGEGCSVDVVVGVKGWVVVGMLRESKCHRADDVENRC